ncbi:MAG: hypothetical protein ACT4OP_06010 [Actinomycetota bacterium]
MVGRRLVAIVVSGLAVLSVSLPLAATTSTTGGETPTTAAGETATTAEPIVPAVTVEVTTPAESQPDWTYRFFIPTLLVLAALVVVATVVQYFTRVVRNRYRVVR